MENDARNDNICRQVKPNGERCQAPAMAGSDLCVFHDPAMAKVRAAARRAGGIERTRRAAVLPPETPDWPLRSAGEVAACSADVFHLVIRGQLDLKTATVADNSLRTILKAVGQSEVEQRLAALEAILKRRPIEPEFLVDVPEPGQKDDKGQDGVPGTN